MMKSFKKSISIMLIALLTVAFFASCEENQAAKSNSNDNISVSQETTAVTETTPDGGTVEKDSEENVITKDKEGKIVSVEDKDGNVVDIDEYVEAHPNAKKSSSVKSSSKTRSKTSGSSKTSSKASSKTSSKTGSATGSKHSLKTSSDTSSVSSSNYNSNSNSSSSTSTDSDEDIGIPKDNVEIDFADLDI